MSTVTNGALRRSREVCMEHGFDTFDILDGTQNTSHSIMASCVGANCNANDIEHHEVTRVVQCRHSPGSATPDATSATFAQVPPTGTQAASTAVQASAPPPPHASGGSSDTVYLTNGGRMRGMVMEEDPTRGVKIKLLDGTVKKLAPADVKTIDYAK